MYQTVEDVDGWFIVEQDTGLVVDKVKSYKSCRALVRKLNLGSGFQGFTPPFFCQPGLKS